MDWKFTAGDNDVDSNRLWSGESEGETYQIGWYYGWNYCWE